jgi:hypothetical protein
MRETQAPGAEGESAERGNAAGSLCGGSLFKVKKIVE